MRSSVIAAAGRSATNSALASTRIDFRSGCGCEATGTVATRLSEKPAATARASGVPALAVYLVFFAISWTSAPTFLNSTTCVIPAG